VAALAHPVDLSTKISVNHQNADLPAYWHTIAVAVDRLGSHLLGAVNDTPAQTNSSAGNWCVRKALTSRLALGMRTPVNIARQVPTKAQDRGDHRMRAVFFDLY